ncbi:hypothetical protein F2Q68_00022112 [Brassica cretica]|uniref:Uncharacterized protein n=1 Tax=Brassica cretica TaxID=69181 RepID=A0A8S9G1U2_BRACR|nr:hypothetical protein F2Q68_00022112 [Brassica cretica]
MRWKRLHAEWRRWRKVVPETVRLQQNYQRMYVPEKCGEFLCQLRGRAKPLPAVKDLIFGGEYEEAARAKLLGDSTMNVVIDKYDTTLKGA